MAKKALTPKQEAFLDALFDEKYEGNVRAAMSAAGYAEGTSVAGVVAPIKEEILERAQLVMAVSAPAAALALAGIVDTPTSLGARDRLNASREILDRVGLGKTENINVKTDQKGGVIFVLPAKREHDDEYDG